MCMNANDQWNVVKNDRKTMDVPGGVYICTVIDQKADDEIIPSRAGGMKR